MKRKITMTMLSFILILSVMSGCNDNSAAKADTEKTATTSSAETKEKSAVTVSDTDESAETKTDEQSIADGKVDLDLTDLSTTMLYSEVFNIVNDPDKYRSQTIRMTGYCSYYYNSLSKEMVYSCLIPDAAACCSQGIQFQLEDGYEYPEQGEKITITGTFDTYEIEPFSYPVIKNSRLEVI